MIAAEVLTNPVRVHEHGWVTESRHPTSEGVVVYVRCIDCDARRVELVHSAQWLPKPATKELIARNDTRG